MNPPIQRGSTVLLESANGFFGHSAGNYGRAGLATQDALREALQSFNQAAGAVLTPSGLSACTLALLTFAKPGGRILAPRSCYGPTRAFCQGLLRTLGVETIFYDPRVGAAIAALLDERTLCIYLESPGSLTFEIQDVPAIAKVAQEHGVPTLIDDTWSAGALFHPFQHGVDIAIQSLTKHHGGHADLLLGVVLARQEDLARRVDLTARQLGMAVGPEDAYLALRGMRTMPLRLRAQGEAGLEIAAWLAARPEVAQVLHPGLPTHPDHALFSRDFSGCCGVFAVVLEPHAPAQVSAMIEGYDLIGMGYSWGGFESLVSLGAPALADGPLLRYSIGLEAVDDLLVDLERGFTRLHSPV